MFRWIWTTACTESGQLFSLKFVIIYSYFILTFVSVYAEPFDTMLLEETVSAGVTVVDKHTLSSAQ